VIDRKISQVVRIALIRCALRTLEEIEMVTAEATMRPDVENRTRLLACVLFVLGGLAIFAPLMVGVNAESRVGLLLIVAAVIEVYHGFRRSSEAGRKAAWQSGAVTVLMGALVINSDSLIFSAFLLFLGAWFAIDALRYIGWGARDKSSAGGALVTWILPALGNAAVAIFILLQYQKAPSWIVSVVGALRIFGTAWNVLAAAVYTAADSSRTTVLDLGLGDDPRLAALGERIQAEEAARGGVDRGWIAGFVATLFAIHLARMGLDRTFLGIVSPAFAVLGDLMIALVAAFGVVIPLRLLWRRATRWLERIVWRWSKTEATGRAGMWARAVLEYWLSWRLRFSIQLRRASYSLPEALSRGLQIGLPVAAIMAAVYPVLGMSWYFDTENWAAGAWDSWAESRTDVWREAMVKAVALEHPAADGATAFAVRPAGVEAGDFAFLVIGDPGEGDASQHVLRDQLITASRQDAVRFLVVSSDVVYPTGAMRDYEAKFWLPFKGIEKPVYAIPGNHDWYDALEGFNATFLTPAAARAAMNARVAADLHLTSTTDKRIDELIARAGRLRKEYGVPTALQEAPFFQIQTKDFALIAVDTGVVRRVDPAELEWLKSALAAARGKFIMVLLGHPLYALGRDLASGSEDFAAIHRLLRAAGVSVTMAGDVHDFEYYAEKFATSSGAHTMHHFVNGGGGAYLSVGTALDFPAQPPTPLWAHYPTRLQLTEKIEAATPGWKRPAWWWTKTFGAWPSSVEWLSAAFDYNFAPFYQSFVEVRVEPSAQRVRYLPWGVHGRLKWSDIEASPGVRPPGTPADALVEWIVPIVSGR
jgi:uncharacterized membrane protein HdeD (DUF308 family)/3',5'-cyclic AMP phosphodiesterase CpdA